MCPRYESRGGVHYEEATFAERPTALPHYPADLAQILVVGVVLSVVAGVEVGRRCEYETHGSRRQFGECVFRVPCDEQVVYLRGSHCVHGTYVDIGATRPSNKTGFGTCRRVLYLLG